MLIVDPWNWLNEDGSLIDSSPRLRAQALRLARLIEYGSSLAPGELRETLVECSKRPGHRKCPGFLSVVKEPDGTLHAACPVCRQDEILIRNWEDTVWASGSSLASAHESQAAPEELTEEQRKRYKKPFPASMDQVRITRRGDEAIIEYADPSICTTYVRFGAGALSKLSDEQILEWHNESLELGRELAAAHEHVAVEIPPGKPQIQRGGRPEYWIPRGGVLRCLIDDGGPNGEAIIHIDDQALSAHEFGRMLTTWAGWGMRVVLVPEDELTEDPPIEVREPDEHGR